MNVSAIIVTRGDVDLAPVLRSLPEEWEIVIWDNSGHLTIIPSGAAEADHEVPDVADLAVYGRYAAIQYASHEIIYVQDDDCIVSDPEAIVVKLLETYQIYVDPVAHPTLASHVVCNMPQEFRHSFYEDHALVGFGAVFHRDAPARAFDRPEFEVMRVSYPTGYWFERTCDIVFTALTPRVLVDVPVEHLPHAYNDDRMYRQESHVDERRRMLELALQVKR